MTDRSLSARLDAADTFARNLLADSDIVAEFTDIGRTQAELEEGAAARLAWTTASETNNAGFSVQHDAGAGWTTLGFVAGHGTTLEAHAYTFRTAQLSPGTHRFRLEQRDLDGATEFSPVVELAVAATGASLLVTPREIRLSLAQPEHVRVALYDALGRQTALLHSGAVDEAATWTTPGGLGSGVYFVRVEGERTRMVHSLVVTR